MNNRSNIVLSLDRLLQDVGKKRTFIQLIYRTDPQREKQNKRRTRGIKRGRKARIKRKN